LGGKNILNIKKGRGEGGGGKRTFGGQKYTKYNKINNNLENFRKGQNCCQKMAFPLFAPLVAGLA